MIGFSLTSTKVSTESRLTLSWAWSSLLMEPSRDVSVVFPFKLILTPIRFVRVRLEECFYRDCVRPGVRRLSTTSSVLAALPSQNIEWSTIHMRLTPVSCK